MTRSGLSNRVIKFRSWVEHEDKISGKNNYSYMQENPEFQGSINAIFATSGKEPLNIYGCKVTYMQFTGLHDKNGVEIYEGDVVRVWEENEYVPNRDDGGGIIDFDVVEGFSQIGLVSFDTAWYAYTTKKHEIGREEKIFAPLDFTSNLVVIGNIFQNGELLRDC